MRQRSTVTGLRDLAAGRTLVVENDGIGHMEATRWYDDLLRTAELPRDERRTLIRLPASAVRVDGLRVASILRVHLVPDGPQRVRLAAGRSYASGWTRSGNARPWSRREPFTMTSS